MAVINNGIFLLTVIFAIILGYSNCSERTLNYAFNEGCEELCKNSKVRLAHVKAIGSNDTLHYLWDFTENPTIFLAITSPTAELRINWHNYLAKMPFSLNFTEKPIYTFGIVIERLFEFNDVNDRGRIDENDNKSISEIKFKNFEWQYKNLTKYDNIVEFYTEAKNYKDPENNETRSGNITFLMHGFGTLNHSRITPHMLHSENATQIDMIINHLETKTNFSNSRFAVELLFASENDPDSSLSFNMKRKLDDEFTPSVFEVMELATPFTPDRSGYLQWRPVSYSNPDRDIVNSSSIIFYSVKNPTVDNYFTKNNLLYIYYGENMFNDLAQRINISIGQHGDSFYQENKYATWTLIVGYGTPPYERFSNIVIMILTIGVGLPLLIFILSGIYICVRRIPNRTDDELLNR